MDDIPELDLDDNESSNEPNETANEPTENTENPNGGGDNTPPDAAENVEPFKVGDEEYDLNNKEQLLKDLELARSSQAKLDEQRSQIEGFIESLKANPIELLKQLNVDITQSAEEFLREKYSFEDLSPEEQELERFRQEKVQWEEQQATIKQQEEERQFNEEREKLVTQINTTLESSGLPANDQTLSLVAGLMQSNKCSPEDAIPHAKKYLTEMVSHFVGSVDGSEFENILGKETLDKIRKYHIEKVRAGEPPPADQPKQTNTSRKKTEPQDLDAFLSSF